MDYKVIDIEGVGPVYAEKLQAAGIMKASQLLEKCAKPAGRKALAEVAGVADTMILKWANHCDLYRIKGVGPQFAELLEAAGYEFTDGKLSASTPISIEYLTNQTSGHVAIAESIQQDLAEIGIELTIQTQDWNVFLEERKAGNFDFAREGWIADFNDPINMLEMWITASGNNDCQCGR